MQVIIKMKPILVTLLLFLLWKFAYLSEVLLKFSKNETFVGTYGIFYFSFLLAANFFMSYRSVELKGLRQVILPAALGYIASLGCIFLTWLVMSEKLSDFTSWISTSYGFMDSLLYYLVIPLPTLGWFITPLAFFLLKIGPNKMSR